MPKVHSCGQRMFNEINIERRALSSSADLREVGPTEASNGRHHGLFKPRVRLWRQVRSRPAVPGFGVRERDVAWNDVQR